jgi:ATP-dependent DNA helicase UvrD/PcrA
MQPTPEQQDILDAARGTQDNICVNALAGVGKTSLLEMLANRITNIPILYLAFNKRIVEEASKRLPGHVEMRTMNALGHRVWMQATGKRLIVDPQKMVNILKMQIEELPRSARGECYEDFADTLRWLRFMKRDGWVPQDWLKVGKPLVTDWEGYGEKPTELQAILIERGMSASIAQAYAGNIDFDDQVYMPVCFGGPWPKFPLVLCDEAQDLSIINHAMFERLMYKRGIIVGDPWQSIYAFRGAVQGGMRKLVEQYSMREFPLSVTWRVPRLGVERAWFRVPHFKWAPEAPDGHIEALASWDADSIPDHAAIICRNNAPLFRVAIRLLRAGRHVKLVGMDIGSGLLRIMKKLGPPTTPNAAIEPLLDRWLRTELDKGKNEEIAYEKYECLYALSIREDCTNLGQAIAYAEHLFKQQGPIQLLSGHKAKGLEWDTVYHLDPWRIPSKYAQPDTEEWEQEMNVRYVVETRFKKELYLIDMEGYNA